MGRKLFIILILILLFSINTTSREVGKLKINDSIQDSKNSKVFNKASSFVQPLTTYSTLWGWMGNGEMGNGSIFPRLEPIQISTDNWISVAGGDRFSLGIKSDSTLWAWGRNEFGEYGNGTIFDSSLIPLQIGQEKNWKFVSAGQNSSFAVKNDGSLWAWGRNYKGVLGDSTTVDHSKPIQIGKNYIGKVKKLCSYYTQIFAITEDGALWGWGSNKYGQLGDGTNVDRYYPVKIGESGEWADVSNGNICTFAIKMDGTLWGWGDNTFGQLGDETKIAQNKPIRIGNDSDWLVVSGRSDETLALKKDGTLWGWGSNKNGKLGDTIIKYFYKPTQIGDDNDWLRINGFLLERTEALKKDSTLWYWGTLMWLKNGTSKPEMMLKPTKIINVDKITQLSACSGYHSFYLRNYVATPAKIETLPISKITTNSAECGGNITYTGSEMIYQRGICYYLRSYPTIENYITEDGNTSGEFQTSLTKLLPFTKYFVRAYVRTAAGDSYGEEKSFLTKLAKPILYKPENNEVLDPIKVTFEWNIDANEQGYRIQLSEYADFSSFIFDTIVPFPKCVYKDLKLNCKYYWRVQTINGAYLSDWSETSSFHTTIFSPQQLSEPIESAINIPIDCQLKWSENTKSSIYILQVSNDESFNNIIIDTILNKNQFTNSKFDYIKSYYWRVKSFIGLDSSNWSPVWKFTTLMDSVKLKSPVDLSSNLELNQNFNWEKGLYDKNFRLQVAKDNDFNNMVFDTLHIQKNDAEIKNLKNYTKYFWRVRNESGDTLGYWSQIWQFKTRMSDILLLYPENTQTGLTQEINLKWYPVIGAEYYQIQISKNNKFTDVVYSMDSLTTTEHFVPDLEKDVLYYWRVRVWNTESIGTAYWSEVWTFKTGTSDVKDEAGFIEIFPNPAGDFITISLKPSEGFAIHIYNTLGQIVLSVGTGRDLSAPINISDLPKGMYFVKVGEETAKFVKM